MREKKNTKEIKPGKKQSGMGWGKKLLGSNRKKSGGGRNLIAKVPKQKESQELGVKIKRNMAE